jgi:hypothetical protein
MHIRSRAVIGALVLALGTGVLSSSVAAAVADEDSGPSLIEFSVPNKAAIDKLNNLGFDLSDYVRPNDDGTLTINVTVTPAERSEMEAMGYTAGDAIETPATYAARQAEHAAAVQSESDARANLAAGRTVAKARGLAAASDTVLVSRADYFENYAGRFISIEAHTTDGKNVSSQNPVMAASWDSGPGTAIDSGGTGNLSPFIDAGAYLYHRNQFRVGSVGDGKPMPSMVRVASANGGVDTIAVKKYVPNPGDATKYPTGFLKDFNHQYVDTGEAQSRVRSLAAEFPNIAQVVNLPYQTNGYQRYSMAIVGTSTAYAGSTSQLPTTPVNQRNQAVQLTSKSYGQNGGNSQSIQLIGPGTPNQALRVSVSGAAVSVFLATNDTGSVSSTAAQVVAAINALPAAAALMTAETYHAGTGTGVVTPANTPTLLSDFLKAPASFPRGPQTIPVLEIGSHRDGSKVGVFIYCQEHAREWADNLMCMESAEELVRNYATDARTKQLVDNLDIFILPADNADGVEYSMYDFASQRKNMTNKCGPTADSATDRNGWGVDQNRNFSVGSAFDGYDGASTSCTSEVFQGPFELSEPEVRNEIWLWTTHPNIKFGMNAHSYGGYFMWPPGAYIANGRKNLPYATNGVNQFFEETGATVLDRINGVRGTAIPPARVGPVDDVLYSAAGNSADEAWYNAGIFGYDFEIGADRYSTSAACTTTGATIGSNCFQPVGFQPTFAPEGHDEGMEFAAGTYGLIEAALKYSQDTTPPTVTTTITNSPGGGLDVWFNQSEPSDVYYTLDGSTPTTSSTRWEPALPRERLLPVHIAGPTTIKWISIDVKGQSSGVQTQVWSTSANGGIGGSVPATLALTLGTPATFGAFTPGLAHDYLATMSANVITTGGDAALTVADPSATATGHLVNGAFSLPQALQAHASSAGGTGAVAYTPVGGSASPTSLLTYPGPVSNDAVSIGFKQTIGSTDALRTGTYSKTLTFTLSTTTP